MRERDFQYTSENTDSDTTKTSNHMEITKTHIFDRKNAKYIGSLIRLSKEAHFGSDKKFTSL